MNSERVEKLHIFLEEEPNNPFLLYALALEYQKNDLCKAKYFFDILLAEHSEYLAAYYQAANTYVDLGNLHEAKQIYEKGILLAKTQDNMHTFHELQTAYQNLLFELE